MLLIPPRELAQFAVESVESARNIAAASTVTSGVIDLAGPITTVIVQLNVTAISGTTPTLAVSIEDTVDGTNWNKVFDVTNPTVNATGITVIRYNARADVTSTSAPAKGPLANRIRFKYTLAGTTPNTTFNVDAYFGRI